MTSYLLDTNVVSELRRRHPHPAVAAWFSGLREPDLYLSVLSVAEIRQGVLRLRGRDPAQAEAIGTWLDRLTAAYAQRILPVTAAVALRWAELNAVRPLPVIDSLLAATAVQHGAVLVTRNVRDLAGTGVPLLDPFAADGGRSA